MFIDVCGLFALCFDDFKDSIYLEPVMRVLGDALSILDDFGEICRIDPTTEQLGRIVVQILGRISYEISASL